MRQPELNVRESLRSDSRRTFSAHLRCSALRKFKLAGIASTLTCVILHCIFHHSVHVNNRLSLASVPSRCVFLSYCHSSELTSRFHSGHATFKPNFQACLITCLVSSTLLQFSGLTDLALSGILFNTRVPPTRVSFFNDRSICH